jgi:DNA-binding IclR family transcriptional regulator
VTPSHYVLTGLGESALLRDGSTVKAIRDALTEVRQPGRCAQLAHDLRLPASAVRRAITYMLQRGLLRKTEARAA